MEFIQNNLIVLIAIIALAIWLAGEWLLGLIAGSLFLVAEYAIKGPYLWAKKPLTRRLNLKWLSSKWQSGERLFLTLKWGGLLAYLIFFHSLIIYLIFTKEPPSQGGEWLNIVYMLSIGLFSGLIYCIAAWTEELHNDPDTQRKNAGLKAEREVRKLIDSNVSLFGNARSLHGLIFFFNEGTDDEYSVETDHILITDRNIYVIETKYKSGTIQVSPDAQAWVVRSRAGEEALMRNALSQVKNSARILLRECNLPVQPIPLVVVYGNDVEIVGGVGNVISAQHLVKIIKAFESSGKHDHSINPGNLANQLISVSSCDEKSLNRHVERVMAAREKEELHKIVRASSVDL